MPKRLMASKAFTDKYVATLNSNGKPQFEHFDGKVTGLLLRVTNTGTRTWALKFKNPTDGVWTRMLIGPYGRDPANPIFTLAVAREKALEAIEKVERGVDPRAKEVQVIVRTVRDVMEDRLLREVSLLKSAEDATRRYRRTIPELILNLPIRDFRKAHLHLILDPILDRGAPIAARRAFEDMSALMNFALSRDEIEFNPMTGAKKPEASKPRQRFLSLDEIGTVWNNLPSATPNKHLPSICRIMLATAQRVGEVSNMRRSQIDVQNRIWTISAEGAKNGHEHAVPLNDLAWEVVSERLKATNGDVLFPANNGGPVRIIVVAHALSGCLEALNVKPFTTHDLRRTVSTQASIKDNGLPVADQWMDHVMNHIGVIKNTVRQRHYNVNTFLNEKRAALDEWGVFLARVVGRDDTMKIAAE